MILSVIIPCYNESATIGATIDALELLRHRLESADMQLDIVAVDDGSTDDTLAELRARAAVTPSLQVHAHERNRGKGSTILTAASLVRGDIVLIQDADLEYDPQDIPSLIAPIVDGYADAVVGSRFGGAGAHRVLYFWHRVGNGALTLLSNMLTDLNVTDMESGYKAFSRDAFLTMRLTSRRFGIEPEILARLSQMGARIYEVPINYYGRTYAEGKKITWRDGVAAIGHIFRAQLTARSQPRLPARRRGARSLTPRSVRLLGPSLPDRKVSGTS
ncbi:MAG: glycosyltransferase family 2 protein [Gemmatimonadaceae bacterium]|nr:glycosyltransferase family 2 protein [Gemmatimonadaceae bacterium]